jgi:hypothetical protein
MGDPFHDDHDRRRMLVPPAEACEKTGWQVQSEKIVQSELRRRGWTEE